MKPSNKVIFIIAKVDVNINQSGKSFPRFSPYSFNIAHGQYILGFKTIPGSTAVKTGGRWLWTEDVGHRMTDARHRDYGAYPSQQEQRRWIVTAGVRLQIIMVVSPA